MPKKIVPDTARFNPRITRVAYDRLQQACKERARVELGQCPHGRILTELIMAYLPPVPGEAKPKKA